MTGRLVTAVAVQHPQLQAKTRTKKTIAKSVECEAKHFQPPSHLITRRCHGHSRPGAAVAL